MTDNRDRDVIAGLTRSQRAALLARLPQRLSEAAPTAATGATAQQAPLSYAQQRLWFIDRLQGPDPTYNIPLGIAIRGWLDQDALDIALNQLIDRHDVLRMCIIDGENGPSLVAQSRARRDGTVLRRVDLSDRAPAQALAEAAVLAEADAHLPFDLSTAPLFRATLIRLGSDTHNLLLTFHHIIADGWSNNVALRDLLALYRAARDGVTAALPALPVGYLDFARWQRDPARAAAIERQTAARQRRLEGAPQGLELATDFPRPTSLSYRGAVEPFAIDRLQTERLREICQTRGASQFMGLLAVYSAVLCRHGAGTDIIIGCPIANRLRPEFEQLLGFFANTMALRIDLGGDPTFSELVARIRQIVLDAYDDQEAPFEQLVERLAGTRGLDRTPLFEALLVFQQDAAAAAPTEQFGLQLEPIKRSTGRVHFPLALGITETPIGLELRLGYQTDLFRQATAERLGRHFVRLLEAATAEPDAPISQLAMLDADELERIERASRTAALTPPAQAGLTDCVDRQASSTPAAAAVETADGVLTYAELAIRSNRLAHHLLMLGARPDRPIGLCADRTLALPIAVLAILKAGCAVLMLDPALPPRRLAALVEQGAPQLILTHERDRPLLPAAAEVVLLDQLDDIDAGLPETPPLADDGLAYILFTSGSTGLPKGVAMEGRAFANLIEWQRRDAILGKTKRTAQFAALGFDVAFQEMFGTWATGGTLILVDQDTRRDPRALWAFIEDAKIERLYLPVVALEHLAEAAAREPDRRPPLEDIIVAGEALVITPAIRAFFNRLKHCRLHNHYGPTETHVATAETLEGDPDGWPMRPTIGRPLAGIFVRVVGAAGELAPLGVAGELWIGGAQLAAGYFGRPDLTAERFVTDAAGRRMYRTGDRVRQQSDGRLEFLGRSDDQVKIRGFRVEPGEVAAELRRQPAVADAVVIAVETTGNGRSLAAYVKPRAGVACVPSQLRADLAAVLPAYCVPDSITLVDLIPVSPNGKIDRKSLPAPTSASNADTSDAALPRSLTEHHLAQIWCTVLGREQIAADADFFELGGHSLLAVRLALRVNDGFHIDLPLRMIFEAPVLRNLAARIDRLVPAGIERPALVPVDRSGPLPLSFAQERLYFLDRLNEASTAYNMSTALRLTGPLDVGALEHAFTQIIRRHEALRTRFVLLNGQPAQIIEPTHPAALIVVDLTDFAEALRREATERHVADVVGTRFDLAAGRLMRLRLLRLGADEHVLIIAFHHIVLDGWSINVLVRELQAFYAGSPDQDLPLPKIQPGDHAVWQRAWLDKAATSGQVDYWRARLAGVPPLTVLPFDRPRPARRSIDGGVVHFELPEIAGERLVAFGRRHQATAFMVFLAGLAAFLFRTNGVRDNVVGTPLANRTVPEIEHCIGFFVNLVALRLTIDDATDMSMLVQQARDVALGAFANQDIPFERVMELVNPARLAAGAPLVNVVMAFQESDDTALQLPGLAASFRPTNIVPTKYDLIFVIQPRQQGYVGAIEYDADLFDHDTAAALAAGFASFVEGAVARPEIPVVDLPLGIAPAAAVPDAAAEFNFSNADPS